MHRARFASALLSATAVIALAGCTTAPPRENATAAAAEPPPYTIERIKRDLTLPEAVKHVRIHNPHGSVAIKPIDSRTLGVYEVVQFIGTTPEKPDIQLRVDGDTAVIDVSYASDQRHGADKLVNGYRKGRVDLGVFLPAAPDLRVTTTYGDLQIRRVENEVYARTRDGRLTIAGGGSIDAATDSGELSVFPTEAKWLKPMKLHSRSGNIRVEVPLYGEIALDIETSGKIAGDVPLELSDASNGRHRGQLRRGGASQHMDVSSETGDVFLIPIKVPPRR
ncbi:MAG: DUF4097 family beta strand repeat protein [Rhodanobacteraceae bacterium]|nr:DUF4097 family beta strand repeat protein [Rhodanobacteraceae bacterium]